MKATIRFGRIFGIEVGINWSLILIAGLLTFELTDGTNDVAVWVTAGIAVVFFFASLLAHELSHSVIARRNGMEVKGITLWLLGGVAQLGGPMPSAGAEFRIAAAGPAMSVALAAAFGVGGMAVYALGASALIVSAFVWLAFVNAILAVFNLIPAAPLDGGRILASIVWAVRKDQLKAELVATRAGQATGIVMIAAGIGGTLFQLPFVSLWTALIGMFVFRAASAERQYALNNGALGNRRVGDVMSPAPQTVRGWATIDAFLAEVAAGTAPRHACLPVERWEGGIVGVVTRDALMSVLSDRRSFTRIVDVMVALPLIATASPQERVLDVLARQSQSMVPCVLVFEADQLVGIITPEDVRRAAKAPEPSGTTAIVDVGA